MYGGYYGYYFDPTYWLVIIGAILCLVANGRVQSAYKKYSKIGSLSGMTGAEAAQRILHQAGIYDVRIEKTGGTLSDHYDPSGKVLRLSDAVYGSASIAALGIAAHECGHAVQHQNGYAPLRIRSSLVPAANIGCRLGIPLVILGLLFGSGGSLLATIGIWVFSASVLFQLVTLPVEFDASGRALSMLQSYGILGGDELHGCKKVLQAAALTYVAAAASSILQLLRLVLLVNGRRRND